MKTPNNHTERDMILQSYMDYRTLLKQNFWEKYEGLNIRGVDYREYVFNYFERELQKQHELSIKKFKRDQP